MKPGFLQDAIKAKALKRQKEWVEPVVKEHKVTKEEYLLIKEIETPKNKNRSSSIVSNDSPMMMMAPSQSTGPDPKTIQLLESLQRDIKLMKDENQKIKNDINRTTELNGKFNISVENLKIENIQLKIDFQSFKNEILASMKNIKLSSTPAPSTSTTSNNTNNNEYNEMIIKELQSDVSKLKIDVTKLKDELGSTQKENQKMKTDIVLANTSISSLQKQMQSLQQQEPPQRSSLYNSSIAATSTPTSPVKESKIAVSSSTTKERQKTPSKSRETTTEKPLSSSKHSSASSTTTPTPSSTLSGDICIDPFTPEKLEYHQRKDEEFTLYRKTKEGLYPMNTMSIQEYSGPHNVVLFYKKVYIPIKLREKLILHYKTKHSSFTNRFVSDKIKEYCIWPTMDIDIPKILKEIK